MKYAHYQPDGSSVPQVESRAPARPPSGMSRQRVVVHPSVNSTQNAVETENRNNHLLTLLSPFTLQGTPELPNRAPKNVLPPEASPRSSSPGHFSNYSRDSQSEQSYNIAENLSIIEQESESLQADERVSRLDDDINALEEIVRQSPQVVNPEPNAAKLHGLFSARSSPHNAHLGYDTSKGESKSHLIVNEW